MDHQSRCFELLEHCRQRTYHVQMSALGCRKRAVRHIRLAQFIKQDKHVQMPIEGCCASFGLPYFVRKFLVKPCHLHRIVHRTLTVGWVTLSDLGTPWGYSILAGKQANPLRGRSSSFQHSAEFGCGQHHSINKCYKLLVIYAINSHLFHAQYPAMWKNTSKAVTRVSTSSELFLPAAAAIAWSVTLLFCKSSGRRA